MVNLLLILLLVCAYASPACAQTSAGTSTQFEGVLHPDDTGTFRIVPFTVPEGTKRLQVHLEQTGREQGVLLTSALWDPITYRGSGRSDFTISAVDATSSYLAGPLAPGIWQFQLGIVRVPPNVDAKYTVRVDFFSSLDSGSSLVLRSGAGWYQGDLHSHTGHSDGVCKSKLGKNVPCPMFRLLEAASAQGLDFLAVTDHNMQAHLNDLGFEQSYYDSLLLLPAQEVTTFNGHANVWGTKDFLDYRIGFHGWTVNNFLDQVHAHHALVSINHAYWPTDQRCPGCGWGWASTTDFSRVDAIEVINGYHEHGSWFVPPAGNGIPFWEARLAAGFRITAVGGSDDHRAGEQLELQDGVALPTTVVYARELSQPALLEGIQAGHVYIKAAGPKGPDLLLSSGAAIMGDEIHALSGKEVPIRLYAKNATGLKIRLLLDGKALDLPLQRQSASATSESQAVARFTSGSQVEDFEAHWLSDGKRHWLRAEILDAQKEVVTVTNPLYINWTQEKREPHD